MSNKTRGAFQIIIKSFISGLKLRAKPRLVGEDYFGTKYYEEPEGNWKQKQRGRSYEPKDKENFEQELPAEWEAWLRYRRKEPPSAEEIEANYRMILTKQENAKKLELEFGKKKDTAMIEGRSDQHSGCGFPVYEDYTETNKNKSK